MGEKSKKQIEILWGIGWSPSKLNVNDIKHDLIRNYIDRHWAGWLWALCTLPDYSHSHAMKSFFFLPSFWRLLSASVDCVSFTYFYHIILSQSQFTQQIYMYTLNGDRRHCGMRYTNAHTHTHTLFNPNLYKCQHIQHTTMRGMWC